MCFRGITVKLVLDRAHHALRKVNDGNVAHCRSPTRVNVSKCFNHVASESNPPLRNSGGSGSGAACSIGTGFPPTVTLFLWSIESPPVRRRFDGEPMRRSDESGRFLQSAHLHASVQGTPAEKHSQYPLRQLDFLQWQPLL